MTLRFGELLEPSGEEGERHVRHTCFRVEEEVSHLKVEIINRKDVSYLMKILDLSESRRQHHNREKTSSIHG